MMSAINAVGNANGSSLQREPKKQRPDTKEAAKAKTIEQTRKDTRVKIAGLGEHVDLIA